MRRLNDRLWPEADIADRLTDVCFLGDSVAKVFLRWRTKLFRAADAFCARRREGPYRFVQNRPRTFV